MEFPEKPKLERPPMCDRLAMEFQDGLIVHLGVGCWPYAPNYVDPRKGLVLHSEDGAIGYGSLTAPEKADRHLVNAGGQHVTALPGTAIVHHADAFGLIGKAMVDVTVMGATRAGLPRRFRSARKPA